ncbi:MAG TPA: hypothetical protein VJT31_36725, partial [Rugosimonospora sp.]|nr:hypothetical protein [Rugosimonospora sp.]
MIDLNTLRAGLKTTPDEPLAIDLDHILSAGRRLRRRRRLLTAAACAALTAAAAAVTLGAA